MTGRLGAPANRALAEWMDEELADNPLRGVDWLSYNRSTLPAETREVWEATIAEFFARRTKQEIATEGLRRGINACVVNEPADVLADPHLAARGFFDTADGLPQRFAGITEGSPTDLPDQQTGSGPGHWQVSECSISPGLGGLDHHQDAGRPRRRCDQDRKPHAA
jgi:crotonobetainyl-CoA:carnitine CoA-transferase CaiB-like acyl-CoA transferase